MKNFRTTIVRVCAGLAALAFPLLAAATPVKSHPRLLFRAEEVPALRARMVATNDVWVSFKQEIVDPALRDWRCSATQVYEPTNYTWIRTSFTDENGNFHTNTEPGWSSQDFADARARPAAPEDDIGEPTGWVRLYSEQYAMIFAFMARMTKDVPGQEIAHSNYLAAARECLMKVIEPARLGHNLDAQGHYLPWQSPEFALADRSFSAESFAFAVDWIYEDLTPDELAKARQAFLVWSQDCDNHYYYRPIQPTPGVTLVNDPALFHFNDPNEVVKREAVRTALNNHYINHMREMALYAMAIDPKDDVPHPALGDTAAAGALTGYVSGPGGNDDWVYQDKGYLRDALGAWLFLTDYAMRNDGGGGISLEGTQYASNGLGPLALLMAALHSAGQDDPQVWGDQVSIARQPFWKRALPGYLAMYPPASRVVTGYEYLGPVYQPPVYGDLENLVAVNDQYIKLFGPLAIYDQQVNGTTGAVVQAVRYIQRKLSQGGEAKLTTRIANTRSETHMRDAIYYFLTFDPAAPAPSDPRPAFQERTFFAAHTPDGSQGMVEARSDATTNATYFHWRLAWNRIDHQAGDSLSFGLWKNGLWLTKVMAGYGPLQSCSDFRNSLSLQNGPPPAGLDGNTQLEWEHGTQWFYSPAGDPQITARSAADQFLYFTGDATALYNHYSRPEFQTIQHASRSIVWLKPDRVIVYDRARSAQAGQFKRFYLNVPEAPTIAGNVTHATAREGGTAKAELFVTTLLPLFATPQGVAITNGNPAAGEDMKARLLVEAPGHPADARFLHVVQGANAGVATADASQLVQSTAGDGFDGAVSGSFCALFRRDVATTNQSLAYTLPATVATHYVTGLLPFAGFNVTFTTNAGNVTVNLQPGTQVFTDGGGVLVLNGSELPNVEVIASAAQASEQGSVPATFLLKRSGDVSQTLSVNYVLEGTATATEFVSVPGVATFAAGSATATLTLTPVDDAIYEGTEDFTLRLIVGAGYHVAEIGGEVSGSILDNDTPPGGSLQFASPTFSVAENIAGGQASVTLTRTGGAVGEVSVRLSTSDGTAVAGVNYAAVSATVTWTNGDTSPKTVLIPITDNASYGGDKTIALQLAQLTGAATLGLPSSAVLTILENETPPIGQLVLDAASYSIAENGGALTVKLKRVNGSGGPVGVHFATTSASAVAGSDFTAQSGDATWPDGGTADWTITIPITDDAVYEGDETFTVTLSSPTGGAALGSPASATVTITDNDPLPLEYEVGPGKPYATPGAIPWASLSAGSTVRIYWRDEPYHDKILLSAVATPQQPVRVLGIAHTNGGRPVLDGNGASAAGLLYVPYSYASEMSLLAVTRTSSQAAGSKPANILVQGLELRGAQPNVTFTNGNGVAQSYYSSAGGIYIHGADNVTIRDCVVSNCANGIVATGDSGGEGGVNRNLVIDRCWLTSSGLPGVYHGYNLDTEAIGMTAQFNRLDRPASGNNVANFRDRSAGTVIRCNWIEGGANALDLVEPIGAVALITADPSYASAFVCGNIFRNGEGDYGTDGSTLIHFGGGYGTSATFRSGTLWFAHNTAVINSARYQTRAFSLDVAAATVEAVNNLVHFSGGTQLLLNNNTGNLHLGKNWFTTGWQTGGGTVTGAAKVVAGTNPLFVNLAGGDLHLATNSPCLDAAQALPAGLAAHPANIQYYPHQQGVLRYTYGSAADLGAFELARPMDQWRSASFGYSAADWAIAANDQAPAGDGLANLWKYATGLDPFTAETNAPITGQLLNLNGTNYGAVKFLHATNAPDTTLTVQVSTNLLSWEDGSSYGGAGDQPDTALTAQASRVVTTNETISVRSQLPASLLPRQHFRVRVR